ncbi:MAG: hypothetical protein KJS83_10860, partial [Xanthomonadaceae bacterium]|nr:hypothetical protein [Xanthomonadaceae bacterium]
LSVSEGRATGMWRVVRAGPLGARSAGEFRQHDVAETGMPGAMVLATFAETKVARSPLRRAEPRLIVGKKTGLQRPSMAFALRANLWLFKFVPDEFVRPAPG